MCAVICMYITKCNVNVPAVLKLLRSATYSNNSSTMYVIMYVSRPKVSQYSAREVSQYSESQMSQYQESQVSQYFFYYCSALGKPGM